MKIDRVRVVQVQTEWEYDEPLGEMNLLRPTEIYEEMKGFEPRWPLSQEIMDAGSPYTMKANYLMVDTDEGATGLFGPIGAEDIEIIRRYFAEILIGENPHSVERIWDKMYRRAIHGRKGTPMMALSKVDLALWDLKGKLLDAPVYQVLGGPSRSKIKAYASMLGYLVEPDSVTKWTQHFADQGFTAFKWFMQYGPMDGEAGIRKNVEIIRAVREAAGPDADLMFDAWSSWNVPYTLRMIEETREYRPYWFEEAVMADLIPQYAELRQAARGVNISGGEHEYTRWGIKSLLDVHAVDILQPDVTWAGGLTEMTKICALASAYNIPVIPHHGGWSSTHLIASQTLTTCPMQEWLFQAGRPNNAFRKYPLVPVDGHIDLPTSAGLSVDLKDGLETLSEEVLAD